MSADMACPSDHSSVALYTAGRTGGKQVSRRIDGTHAKSFAANSSFDNKR